MSEREPNTTPAPQSGDVSAVELGSAPPSRSENAVRPDALAWAAAHPCGLDALCEPVRSNPEQPGAPRRAPVASVERERALIRAALGAYWSAAPERGAA